MASKEQMHAWAKKTLEAQSFTDLERSKCNTAIAEEAKLHGTGPNEVLQYVQNNFDALSKEIASEKKIN